jgi:hypothetical protein
MGECRGSCSWRRPRSTSGCVARASRVILRAPRLEVPSSGYLGESKLTWRESMPSPTLVGTQSKLWFVAGGKSPAISIGRVQAIMASYIFCCHVSANSQIQREDSPFRHDAAGVLLHAPRAAQVRLSAALNSRRAINVALVPRMRGEDPRRMYRLMLGSALAVSCVNASRRADARNERDEQQLFPRRVCGYANV